MPKFLDDNGLLYFWQKIKSKFLTNVAYDSTNKKLTKTINGTTSDIVAVSTIKTALSLSKSDVGLGNVDNTSDANKVVASAGKLTAAASIDGVNFDGTTGIVHYGECSTAAATVAKTVNCPGFNLVTGAIIYVRFTVTNSGAVASLTLNVNDTGAKNIKYRNANLSSAGILAANRVYCFVYDGTYYQLVGDLDTNSTYTNLSLGQGYGTTSTGGATQIVTLAGYSLTAGGIIVVKFNNAVPAEAKLSVNNKGARSIIFNNAPIEAGVIGAGDKATFIYDGDAYHLLTVDSSARIVTTSAKGLMSASDKSKLNGIASGAEVNQNAFSNVKIGTTTVAADSKTDTLELVAGSNVTITPDATNDKITIAATNTTYSDATTTTHGLMSAADKEKLDSLQVEDIDVEASGSGGWTYTAISLDGTTFGVVPTDPNGLAMRSNLPEATTSAKGAMTAEDKTKLNGIASGAEVNQNAFSNVKVGSTTVAADAKTDTLELVAGANVTLTPDATNDKITIAATNTTYSDATTSSHGLMTAADKTKLNKLVFDSNNLIDSSILPSYVDDVIEAYARSGQTALSSTWLATGSASGTVITPETGKIYVLMADSGDYAANTQFRWSGTAYVKLADGGVSAITNSEIDTIVAA